MTLFHVLAGTTLAFIGVIHSVLGEAGILRPLLADDRWDVGAPRWAAERILRFAWHATTIAWFALAATAFGVDGTVALTVTALLTGLLVLALLPAHLAWPLFLLAALWGAVAAGVIGTSVLATLAFAAAVVAVAAALVHLAWAAGRLGSWAATAVPTRADGTSLFAPSTLATVAVAVALSIFAAALVSLAIDPTSLVARVLVAGATLVLAVRAIGDGRYVGFTKKLRSTAFGRRDDAVFTPLVAALAIGGAAALAI